MSTSLRINEMLVTPLACPDPPLLNHHGVHEPFFLRAIVRLRTEDGLEGVGEGPGGGLYVQQLRAAARHLVGASAYHLEALRVLVGDPRVFSTIEVALLDLIGKATGRRYTTCSAAQRADACPSRRTSSTRRPATDEWGQALTPEELVKQAERFADLCGMTVFKVKGGVLEPDAEVATVKLLRERFGPRARTAHRPQRGMVGRDVDPRRRQAAGHRPGVSRGPDRRHRGHVAGCRPHATSR